MNCIKKEDSAFLKGVAITGIVIGHIFGRYSRLYTPVGGVCVGLFLFLSGYGLQMSYEKNGLSRYWFKRIVAVFVPYIISRLLTIVIWHDSARGIVDILLDFLLIKPFYPYGWYLNHLLICCILFWMVHKSFTRSTYKIYCSIFVLICASIIFMSAGMSLYFEQVFTFPMGILFVKSNIVERLNRRVGLCGIASFLVSCVILCIKQGDVFRVNYNAYMLADLLIKTFAVFGLVCLFVQYKYVITKTRKYFEIIGKYSLELYLMHGYAVSIFNSSEICEPIKGLITIFISVFFALILHAILSHFSLCLNRWRHCS